MSRTPPGWRPTTPEEYAATGERIVPVDSVYPRDFRPFGGDSGTWLKPPAKKEDA